MSVDVRCGYWDTLPALGLRGALRRLACVTDPVHSIAPHEEFVRALRG